jgi:hypothetical protein
MGVRREAHGNSQTPVVFGMLGVLRAPAAPDANWCTADSRDMKPVGERSAGNPHAAFDERGQERGTATALALDSTRVNSKRRNRSNFNTLNGVDRLACVMFCHNPIAGHPCVAGTCH